MTETTAYDPCVDCDGSGYHADGEPCATCFGSGQIPAESPESPKVERDEVLEAEVRDQYRDLGLGEDSIREAMAAAAEAGMFDVPDWR